MNAAIAAGALALSVLATAGPLRAHSGPPYPIVTDWIAGPYAISIWTDPDATDDGTAGGQFWVVFETRAGLVPVPPGTHASVTVRPLDRAGQGRTVVAQPVDGRVSRQFAALVLDREGRFAVQVIVNGPLGRGELASEVDATYDLRPAPVLLLVYLLPFLAVGAIWVKVLRRRTLRC